MGLSKIATGLALLSTTSYAQYTLQQDFFANGNFFSGFTFWDTADPTDGFVEYQSQSGAQSLGLISSSGSNAQMKVSASGVTPNGRPSVRITSQNSWDNGLVIVDIDHMPGGICGTWPAFWMVGPNWPSGGEIDIIEGVNDQNVNDMTLHTSDGCSIGGGSFTGTLETSNCYVDAPGQADNQGCGITTTNTATYGASFNNNGGGVYATEINSDNIQIWFFPRDSIPSDVETDSPDPSGWGEPLAMYSGNCDIPERFTNLQIVFDTTLCGSWAGNVWSDSSYCSSQAASCDDFVANNPSAFTDAYWSVNLLRVFTASSGDSDGHRPTHKTTLSTKTRTPYHGPTPNKQVPWKGAGAPTSTPAA